MQVEERLGGGTKQSIYIINDSTVYEVLNIKDILPGWIILDQDASNSNPIQEGTMWYQR